MNKQLPMGSLPRDVQNVLETLLQKEKHALAPSEIAFLRGRRDYLTSDQRKFYGVDEKVEMGSNQEDAQNKDEVAARLKELGVKFDKRAKVETLVVLLKEAEQRQADELKESEERAEEAKKEANQEDAEDAEDEEVENQEKVLTLDEVKAELDNLDIEYEEEADEEELRDLLADAR